MTDSIAEVERIAAGLTKAQRACLTQQGNTPMDDAARDKPGVARQVHDMGLTFIDLSPIGYRVRAHLMGQAS